VNNIKESFTSRLLYVIFIIKTLLYRRVNYWWHKGRCPSPVQRLPPAALTCNIAIGINYAQAHQPHRPHNVFGGTLSLTQSINHTVRIGHTLSERSASTLSNNFYGLSLRNGLLIVS